jgi:uncharacterized protein
MIFVDTGGWFASMVPTDPNHLLALKWLNDNSTQLFTTDYIIDETLTLLRVRGEHQRALHFGRGCFDGNLAVIYHLSETDVQSAWSIFEQYSDKDWSFTDCTSKAVMDRLGIASAFAFDRHFHQFATINVVP